MAVIRGVSVQTTSPLYCRIISEGQGGNRLTPRNCSGPASLSSGACRGCKGVGLDHIGFVVSGRISDRCWRGWKARIGTGTKLLGQRRGRSVGVGGSGQLSAAKEDMGVMEGDVVEYPLAGVGEEEGESDTGRIGVGVIVDMFKDSDALVCQIEPLCQEDEGSKEWIQDELQPEITVPIGQVRVLQAWYSQRMVPDRISNPHGEHAEDLWILE